MKNQFKMNTSHVYCLLIGTLLSITACAAPQEQTLVGGVPVIVEEVATGLEIPWALAWEPDGTLLVTERAGRLRAITAQGLQDKPLLELDFIKPHGEGGLMGLALHPDYQTNRYLFISYSYPVEGEYMVRVVRYQRTADGVENETVILDNIPAARFHAGCALAFGPDGKLYITTGDALKRNLAQVLNSLAGKTLRLEPDGSIPPDNPFVSRPDAQPHIWSYGHRNAQGIDWHPETGEQFQTEHGPSGFDGPGGGDEINIIKKGENYGWPVVHHDQSAEGMVKPLTQFTPAIAPGGSAFYTSDRMPQLKGDFFIGCLRGVQLMRLRIVNGVILEKQSLFSNRFGRIRHVATGPDGALYFTTSNRDGRGVARPEDDKILRLVPAVRE